MNIQGNLSASTGPSKVAKPPIGYVNLFKNTDDGLYYGKKSDDTIELIAAAPTLPYLIFQATVTQSSTSAPVISVKQNTTGAIITPSYNDVGSYTFTSNLSIFPFAKTTLIIGQSSNLGVFFKMVHDSTSTFQLSTTRFDSSGPGFVGIDGQLLVSFIEIRIYP